MNANYKHHVQEFLKYNGLLVCKAWSNPDDEKLIRDREKFHADMAADLMPEPILFGLPVSCFSERILLWELPDGKMFKVTEYGQILRKAPFVKGDNVSAYSPFGNIMWFHKNSPVLPVTEKV